MSWSKPQTNLGSRKSIVPLPGFRRAKISSRHLGFPPVQTPYAV